MAKHSKKKRRSPEPARLTSAGRSVPGKSLAFGWMLPVQALVLVAAVCWIYAPALHGAWLWDDDNDITDNLIVHSPTGLWSIWFEPSRLLAYYPVTFSVEWIEWHLWGMDTLGYHIVNVLLHLISSLLVWRVFAKLGLRFAWLGGLIFAIHPVQVESIAWIAEVKNALCLPPFLLAMCFYLDYEEHKRGRDYWLTVGLFLFAMLCKTSMASFPLVILLYAWWKRGRIGCGDLKASAPFFLISLAVGLMAIRVLQPFMTKEAAIPLGGLFSRLACAGQTITFYFSKCFVPVDLMPIYPQWTVDPPSLAQFLPWPILVGAICWLWTKRETWGRHALLGFGFFLILLAPFVGLIKTPYMGFTWVMDHELYLAIIGLIGLTVAALGQIQERLSAPFRLYGMGAVAVMVAVLAWGSREYALLYVDEETLWTYTVQYNPASWRVQVNLATALLNEGRSELAIERYQRAVQINSNYAPAHNNMGAALLNEGRTAEAAEQFKQAVAISPNYAVAHNNLGNALDNQGHTAEAIGQYQEAARINPYYAEAHYNMGNTLLKLNRLNEAIEQFQESLRINPNFANPYNSLGYVLQQQGRTAEAIEQYEQALRVNPNYTLARTNLEKLEALQNGTPAKN